MTWNQGTILLVGFAVAAVVGVLLLPGRLFTGLMGTILVAVGIWWLVSALLLRRGIVWAGWGWGSGNPPDMIAWQGVGVVAMGLGTLSGLVLSGPGASATSIAGTLVFLAALILARRVGSKNKGS